jgi:hypothetical protein
LDADRRGLVLKLRDFTLVEGFAGALTADEKYNVNVGVDLRTPNEKNDEDQSEANDWIIFDFSEEEATARRSA